MVRSSWDRPLRGPPAAIRCPNVSRLMQVGRCCCAAGRSSRPYGNAGSPSPAAIPWSRIRSRSSSAGGSAGSHGLCAGRIRSPRAAAWIALTSTVRSVTSSSSRCPAAGRCGSGRPAPAQSMRASHGGSVARAPGAAVPGLRPPTRPAWNGTSEAWPSRT